MKKHRNNTKIVLLLVSIISLSYLLIGIPNKLENYVKSNTEERNEIREEIVSFNKVKQTEGKKGKVYIIKLYGKNFEIDKPIKLNTKYSAYINEHINKENKVEYTTIKLKEYKTEAESITLKYERSNEEEKKDKLNKKVLLIGIVFIIMLGSLEISGML